MRYVLFDLAFIPHNSSLNNGDQAIASPIPCNRSPISMFFLPFIRQFVPRLPAQNRGTMDADCSGAI